jgi:deazaflavin-dependent oxidoreductase (nitroreductase family)
MSAHYNKPSGITQLMNRFMSILASVAMGPKKMVTLEVRGRKTGEPRSVAVNVSEHDGQEYLVAPRGETEWVRNVRAAGGEAVIRRGKRRRVNLQEVPVTERAPIIQSYLSQNEWVTSREFGMRADAPMEDFQRVAPNHPVFRITDL